MDGHGLGLGLFLFQLAMGFSLAAATGLRAFLPLFAAAVCARTGYVDLAASFDWLASTPALLVFGSAVVFELAGDKIPAVDHALDAAGVLVKPTAATLLSAALFTNVDPVLGAVLGLASGGAVAGTVHLVKAKTRLVSSLVTAGFANPVVSVVEDVASLLAVVVSIVLPVLAAFMALAVLGLAVVWFVRRRSARTKGVPPLPDPA